MIHIALQVWLPLTGDLRNNGVENPTISCNATIDNAGKIGKCYVCASGNHISFTNPITTSTTEFSVACWVYITEYTDGYSCVFSSRTGTAGKGIALWITSSYIRLDDGETWRSNYTFTLNTWTHICVMYSKTNGKSVYVNGNLIGSKATVGTLANLRSELFIGYDHYGYYLGGKINDLRVWEGSTPSPKEIELIARGLVLHYPMTGGGRGGDNLVIDSQNLYTGSSVSTKYIGCRGGNRQLRDDGFYESKCTALWQGLSTWSNAQNFAVGDIITYSFYTYISGSAHEVSFYPIMYNSAGTRDTTTKLPISVDGSSFVSGNARSIGTISSTIPEFHYVTFEWNSAVKSIINNGGRIELSIQASSGNWTDSYICFFKPKLEKGSKPTSWIPNSVDTSYISMGYNDNTEYDVSGYLHNGTINSSVSYSSDSARYSISTTFDGASAINCGNGYNVQGAKNMTISLWAYLPDWTISTKQVFISSQQSGGFYIQRGSGTSVSFRCHYYNAEDLSSHTYNTITYACTLTGWHMLTATYDTSAIRLYLDGVQVTSASLSGSYGVYFNPAKSVNTYIGAEATASSYETPVTSGCKISDVRIYYTTLTADQVKELYNTAISISNNGTLMGYEFIEN